MGVVDRLQSLDDRFLPERFKARPPGPPPEWSPAMGALVSLTRVWVVAALGLAASGVALTVVQVVRTDSRLAMLVFIPGLALAHGYITSWTSQHQIETSLTWARPVAPDVPLRPPMAVAWPYLSWLVVVLLVLGSGLFLSPVGPGMALGTALSLVIHVRWLRRWQRQRRVEVLLRPRHTKIGYYLRPATFSDGSVPETGTD